MAYFAKFKRCDIQKANMNIHIICPVFPPESVASAVMAENVANGITAAGHETTVITSFPSKMKGELFPGFKRTVKHISKNSNSVKICRVFTIFSKKSTLISRFFENFSYAVASNVASILCGRPDVIYLNTWPVISTFLTAVFCMVRRVPFIYNVQDVYPESAAGLGLLKKGGRLYQLLIAMDRFVMSRAITIIPNSEEFAELIHETRKIPYSKMTVVWNWYDACIVPKEKWGAYRQTIASSIDSCVSMYAGNIGSVAGLEIILDAAELLSSKIKYVFVLAGDGTLRQHFEEECKSRGIDNVKFYYPLKREDLGRIQAAADIMLITTKKGLSLSEVPSKIMGYMLSGRPILAAVDETSNTARLVKLANCGVVVPPENAEFLANAVVQMHHSPKLGEWGTNARLFAEQHFDQDRSVAKVVSIIEAIRNPLEKKS